MARSFQQIPSLTIGTSVGGSTAINMRVYAGGHIYVLSGVGLTTLTWYVSNTLNGTYVAAQDGIGEPVVSSLTPGQACPIPPALFGCMFAKAVGNAAASVGVSLKS